MEIWESCDIEAAMLAQSIFDDRGDDGEYEDASWGQEDGAPDPHDEAAMEMEKGDPLFWGEE